MHDAWPGNTPALNATKELPSDPVPSSDEFSLDYMGFSTYRTGFRAIEGSLEFDAARPAASSVNASIPVASVPNLAPVKPQDAKGTIRVDMNAVRTAIDRRDAHMRSKDFPDTEASATNLRTGLMSPTIWRPIAWTPGA